jgi:hypothetical protein
MTEEEKASNPNIHITGGQLRKCDYKEAFKLSWDYADPEDRIKVKELPNFDAEIFYEISGIDLRENYITKIYHCDLCNKKVDHFFDYFPIDTDRIALIKKETKAEHVFFWKKICNNCHERLLNIVNDAFSSKKISGNFCNQSDIYGDEELHAYHLSLFNRLKLLIKKMTKRKLPRLYKD